MRNQDWKLKYKDLKLKFHDAVDVAFRLGVEQGMQQAQIQEAQQAQMMAQQADAQSGMPGQEEGMPGEENPEAGQPNGSELDEHIGTLESMLEKADPTSPDALTLKKSLEGLKAIQHSFQMAKSTKSINQIAKNMKKPFSFNKRAEKNLPDHAKKALSNQEKIVDDIMKSMAEEEEKVTEAIKKTLSFEQLLKG